MAELHYLDDPVVRKVFTDVQGVIVGESDRGAVLVGLTVVDEHLEMLLDARPAADGRRRRARRAADRLRIAMDEGLISRNVFDAINHLRKLRNAVAHSLVSFDLADHRDTLRRMCEIGETMPEFVSFMARKALFDHLVEEMKDLHIEIPGEEPQRAFNSPIEVAERLAKVPGIEEKFQEKARRLEVGLAVGFICALIGVYRLRPNGPEHPGEVISALPNQSTPANVASEE